MHLVRAVAVGLAPVLLLSAGLGAGKPAEPEAVVVQHILVGFKSSVRGKTIDRTKAEASTLAQDLVVRARAGEDFDVLVRTYTDDSHPGIYKLTNTGAPRMSGARTRDQMVPGFGDLSFRLAVGEVGLVPYHGANSPYGWHVVKRLE